MEPTLKYVVIERPGDVQIRECEKPHRKRGEVLLKMIYGGLCGSDLGTYKGTFIYASYPRIPGHEFSASIEEIDEADAKKYALSIGMVVTALPYFNCGHCFSCEHGYANCCMHNETMGAQRDGAFCEYIIMPAEHVFNGKGLSPLTLAMVEPFCISYHAMQKAEIKKGERVLIIGGGPIGLLGLLAARLMGAEVTVADVVEQKLQKALDIGASHVICLKTGDFAEQVNEITNSDGFDVCVEAAGVPDAFINAIDSATFHGRVIVVGVSSRKADLTYSYLQKKELTVSGSRNALSRDFINLIDLLKQNKDIEDCVTSLVTDEIPFLDAKLAFSRSVDPSLCVIKTILRF